MDVGRPVVHVGMRYWPPYVHDVLRTMAEQGLRSLLAVILSPFQCSASWEAYQQVVAQGVAALGKQGPQVTYLPPWHTHPGFLEAIADTIRQASAPLGPGRAQEAALIYTAHAIPTAMAPGAPYPQQFAATAAAATQLLGCQDYRLAYQSQATGSPFPWLQPDINDAVQHVHTAGYRDVIVVPIGFLCDHVEVLYDLDIQARDKAMACGMTYRRAAAVGAPKGVFPMLSEGLAVRLGAGGKGGAG